MLKNIKGDSQMKQKQRVIILGAAGRDFHNFNTCYRDKEDSVVVAFTAAQIPDIDGRKYPAELAGKNYPAGIPIYSQKELTQLITELDADLCAFSYSDVSYNEVMSVASEVNAAGADFLLIGTNRSMIKSAKPIVSVGAVRTGAGKSQTSRRIIEILMGLGVRVVAIRHPMPYGDLKSQKVQRFAELEDLERYNCTIEEMEEYEPHILRGNVIYAGIDYEAIIREAEKEADVIVWDGGNNDFPFYRTDLMITLVDPHRAGHELSYYPGETVLRMADVALINKIDTADAVDIQTVRENIEKISPGITVIDAASPITADKPDLIKNKRVLVIEDGPTLTHGNMKIGAGVIAARKFGSAAMVDPRPFAAGKLKKTFDDYPDIGALLPAMGYGEEQIRDLEETINNTDCDTVIIGTPIDLNRIINIKKPTVRVTYSLQEIGKPDLTDVLIDFVEKHNLKQEANRRNIRE
jgi:predicted GTPase